MGAPGVETSGPAGAVAALGGGGPCGDALGISGFLAVCQSHNFVCLKGHVSCPRRFCLDGGSHGG